MTRECRNAKNPLPAFIEFILREALRNTASHTFMDAEIRLFVQVLTVPHQKAGPKNPGSPNNPLWIGKIEGCSENRYILLKLCSSKINRC